MECLLSEQIAGLGPGGMRHVRARHARMYPQYMYQIENTA
jgi:hypothetical protein